MKERVLDANELMTGSEPKVQRELSKFELVRCLNWYSQNRINKDAQKYASDFFKKKYKIVDIEDILKHKSSTIGFICRIVSNGATLDPQSSSNFEAIVKEILQEKKQQVTVIQKEEKQTVSIQDRIKEKVSEIIGDLEGAIDNYILSNFKDRQSPIGVMNDKAKGVHARSVIDHFKNQRSNYEEALSSSDPYVSESWSSYKKSDLKKIVAYIDQIILDANTLIEVNNKTRKPRKRKVKTPDQLVSKLLFCKEFEKLMSVDPKNIIGASQLWVYNTKYRKLGVYHSADIEGLTVKGSTIQNYREDKSTQKTLRKPDQILPEVLSGGKIFLRNVLSTIKSVETNLNGRINKDVILLRIVK